jgi:hypothetical protein
MSRARLSPGPFVRRYDYLPVAPGPRRAAR